MTNISSVSSVFEDRDESEEFTDLEEATEKKISYDPRIIPALEDIKRQPQMENDSVILITGRPGVGKSKLAQDIAYYLDPTFNIDRIVFNVDDLIEEATKKLPRGSAIIFDEAAEAVDSVQTLSQKNQRMAKFLATVRSRCLFIILVQPSFWSFMMSIATERSDVLFHVEKVKNRDYDRNDPSSMPFKRGYYSMYSYERKKRLYISGKKWHVFNGKVKPNLHDIRFGSRWVVDKEEYQRRKDIAVAKMNQEADDSKVEKEVGRFNNRVNAMRLQYLKSFKQNWPSLSLDTFAQLSGETRRTLLLVMDADCRRMYDVGPHTK